MKGQIADKLNTEERCELKDEDFGIPETRDSFFAGSRMPDAPHVRAAEAYFRYAPEDKKEELARRILMKARKFGVNIQSPTILEWDQEKSGR